MKIEEARNQLLLINPALADDGRSRFNVAGMVTMEPLGLAYVAALTPDHWHIRIVDETREALPTDVEPDLVAITSLTPTAPRAYAIAARFRERGVPVIMGGVHATLAAEEATRYVDVIFTGEAEGAWPQLIRDFEAGELQPRYDGGAPPLAGRPRPRRDLHHHRYVIRLISASRGCRYRCEFCSIWKFAGGRYRTRPPQEVWDELATCQGGRALLFTDDNVATDREWALALFRGMAQRGLRQRHAVQASLDVADDDELLRWLKRSGCFAVQVGLESVSPDSLRAMRKGVNLRIGVSRYREKIGRLHDHGLTVAGTFMFGNDGDDPDIFQRTVEFVLETGIDLAHFGLLTPMPGTDLFARLRREGRLLYTDFPADYARYDLRTAVFRPRRMTPEQLEEGLVWASQAISRLPVLLQRAGRTWRDTGDPVSALLALQWNRTGLYRRVVGR